MEFSSDQINDFFSAIDGNHGLTINKSCDERMKNTGKPIPYIGWYWRRIDFDSEHGYPIGHIKCVESGVAVDWIGFIANNKWGYDERLTTPAESKQIRLLCERIVSLPSQHNLLELFDYLQTLKVEP